MCGGFGFVVVGGWCCLGFLFILFFFLGGGVCVLCFVPLGKLKLGFSQQND